MVQRVSGLGASECGSGSTDFTAIAGNMVILAGKLNYQRWAWSVKGTAKLGLFWLAYKGTNNLTDPTNDTWKETCNQ